MRPTKKTFDAVAERDFGRCAWCGQPVQGERGRDFSLHHRRPAGMGGDRRPETHAAANLVLLHGSGCTRCHGVVESARALAFDRGATQCANLAEAYDIPVQRIERWSDSPPGTE